MTLTIYKAGWIIGGSGGSGTLKFRGRTYGLSYVAPVAAKLLVAIDAAEAPRPDRARRISALDK